jgi:hypothetical protein
MVKAGKLAPASSSASASVGSKRRRDGVAVGGAGADASGEPDADGDDDAGDGDDDAPLSAEALQKLLDDADKAEVEAHSRDQLPILCPCFDSHLLLLL